MDNSRSSSYPLPPWHTFERAIEAVVSNIDLINVLRRCESDPCDMFAADVNEILANDVIELIDGAMAFGKYLHPIVGWLPQNMELLRDPQTLAMKVPASTYHEVCYLFVENIARRILAALEPSSLPRKQACLARAKEIRKAIALFNADLERANWQLSITNGARAEARHVLQTYFRDGSPASAKTAAEVANPTSTGDQWITVAKAAHISGLTEGSVSRAATAGEFKTNGKSGRERRIDAASFINWHCAKTTRNSGKPL
jgi:hypothetical protein